MRTIKRNVNSIDTSLSGYDDSVKYFQQVEWKGIVENKNLFTTDQLSQADAKNVYVDTHGSLVSREPLQEEKLSTQILPESDDEDQYYLRDVLNYSNVVIYSVEHIHYHGLAREEIITAKVNDNYYKFSVTLPVTTIPESEIKRPVITTIENYVICFNDDGAKVFDINNTTAGWQNFTDFVEVPVTERTVGNVTETYPGNNFTDKYIKEYIWSNLSEPTIPETAEFNLIVNSGSKQYKWTIPEVTNRGDSDANALIQYTTLRAMNSKMTLSTSNRQNNDIFSVSGRIVCIAKSDNVLISYDNGATFTREWYPTSSEGFIPIASVSDDGECFFYVHRDGVHRLDLGDKTWTHFYPHDDNTKKLVADDTSLYDFSYMVSFGHFLNSTTFTFIINTSNGPELWFMAPTLIGYDSVTAETAIIPEEYRGTLGCSKVFIENNTNLLKHYYSFDNKVEVETIKSYLKIIQDEGNIWENMTYNSDGLATGGTMSTKTFQTIIFNGYNYYTNDQCIETLILPGSNCPTYINNGETYSEALNLKPTFFDSNGFHAYAGELNSVSEGGAKAVSLPETKRGSATDWLTSYPPRAFIIESIENLNTWLIGEHVGESGQTVNNKYPTGIYTIRGAVYIRNLPELENNSQYSSLLQGTNWYQFVYQIGWTGSNELSQEAYFELTNRLPVSNEPFTPLLTQKGDYIASDIIFTPVVTLIAGERIYSNWLYMPTELKWVTGTGIVSLVDDIYVLGINGNNIYIYDHGTIYTNALNDEDTVAIQARYTPTTDNYTDVPNIVYSGSELYLGFDNKLSITANSRDTNGNILFNLPSINDQRFVRQLTNIINISTTEIALFFEDQILICSKIEDETLGYRYDYYPTKLSTGTRLGDSVINTIEGTYTIFPTKRGLAFMNYQAFMATTDQVLTYITDNIENKYDNFYANGDSIKLIQCRERLYMTNGTGDILIYDLNRGQWWYWEIPVKITKMSTDQLDLRVIAERLYIFKEHKIYEDFPHTENAKRIDWYIISQPLHLNAINYYKNLKQLVFHLLDTDTESKKHTIVVQIQCYRKKLDTKNPEIITFKIDELRTFVKRFNYWKLNEVQYALGSDNENVIPTKLKLNGISIKYELGEGVR